MATSPSILSALLRPFRSADWLTLLLVIGGLLVVVRTIQAAAWVETSTLEVTLAMGALSGFIVAHAHRGPWRSHLLALLSGAVVVYIQGATLSEADGVLGKLTDLGSRLTGWTGDVAANDISADVLPFAVVLTALVWLGSYVSSWLVFKTGNVWLAILPSAIGLITNLTYLPERFFPYLFPYLFFAMLLIVRLTSLRRQSAHDTVGIQYPTSLRILSMGFAVLFSVPLLLAIAALPDNTPRNDQMKKVWNDARWPLEQVQRQFDRLFPAVTGFKEAGLFGSFFPIHRNVTLSEEEVFLATSPFASYWNVRAYTTYTGTGWKTEDTSTQRLSAESGTDLVSLHPLAIQEEEGALDLPDFPYEVETARDSTYLFLPSGVPLDIDIPVKLEARSDIPPYLDILSIRPQKRLDTGAQYSGTTLLDLTGGDLLRTSSGEYPNWVTETYLDLPRDLPQRVKQLTRSLTGDEPTLYDKALSIEAYLRTMDYETSTDAPPFDADLVDYFLFESQTGHSDHFASAMAVMLRAAGIPARLISGYGPGIPDQERGAFVIRNRDRHSWTEAYLPGMGWVEFEPSPNSDLRPRAQSDLIGFGKALALIEVDVAPLPELASSGQGLEEEEEEDDEGFFGGRLPGGFGIRPFPLANTGTPLGLGGSLFGILVIMWLGALLIVWRRYYLVLPKPNAAYDRLCRLTAFLVQGPLPAQTPLEFGRFVGSLAPAVQQDVDIICQMYSKSRYGRGQLTLRETLRVGMAWRRVRRALVRSSLG